MSTLRTLVIAGALAALASTSMAAPAGAADTTGTIAIVNGVPGLRLDVCINGDEIKSRLAYGRAVLRNSINTTEKILDFYESDPRECKGRRVAHHDGIGLSAGDDLTIVVTKKAPRIVIFDNVGLGEIPPNGGPTGSYIAMRHAADFSASFKVTLSFPEVPLTPDPAADPVWTKGDQSVEGVTPSFVIRVRATRPDRSRTAAVKTATIAPETRHEWILVRLNADNARFAFLARPISAPSP